MNNMKRHGIIALVPIVLVAGFVIGVGVSLILGGLIQVSASDPCGGTQSFFDWQTGTTRFGTVLPRSQQQFEEPRFFDRRGHTSVDRWFEESPLHQR